MAAKILAFIVAVLVWEANSKQCGGSIFIPIRPPLAEESPISNPPIEESSIFINPLRPPYAEESPIYSNPIRSLCPKESPIYINSIRPPFAKNSSSPKLSSKIVKTLPVSRGKLSSEKFAPLFKAPSFSVTCKSSEPMSPLSVKTSLLNSPADSISDCEKYLPLNCDQNIIPLSAEKPIKFHGPRVNIEVANVPFILPQPAFNDVVNTNSFSNVATPCDLSSNLFDVQPQPASIAQDAASNLSSPNPVSLINRRPVIDIIPTTRSLQDILNSLKNNSPYYENANVPSSSNVAESPNTISSNLRQSSAVNINANRPEQVYQSSYSSNILGCSETDPTWAHTSVSPITTEPCYPSSINADASSSIPSSLVSSSSASSFSQVGLNPANTFSPSYQPSNFMQASSTASSGTEFNRNSATSHSSNTFGCPETDPLCSYTSVPPSSAGPWHQSSGNNAGLLSSMPSNIVSSSSASTLNSGQAGSNLANTFSTSYRPSNYVQASSLASSSVELNPSPATPYSSNILVCPETDPFCSHTSILPITTPPYYQSSVNKAEILSSISSSLESSSFASSFSSDQIGSNLANAFSTSNQPSNLMQASSQASSGIEFNPRPATPYSSNILGCPETDPFCSYTSIPPITTPPSYQSSVNNAESTSSISSSVVSSPSTSISSSQVGSNRATNQPSNFMQASSLASSGIEFNPNSATTYSSNIVGCPETDPFCFHTSIPPITTPSSYQSSVNNAESTSSISSSVVSSPSTSISSGQAGLNRANTYSASNQPPNFVQATSQASSGIELNQSFATPYTSNILGCPETDPLCSYTSIPPITAPPFYQSSVNNAESTSSISSSVVSSPSTSISSGQAGLNRANTYSASNQPPNFVQATSQASSGIELNQSFATPYTSNILGCPETDPLCSYTSIPPITAPPFYQSSVNNAESTSSISSSVVSSPSTSISSGQFSSNLVNPYLSSTEPIPQLSSSVQTSSLASSGNELNANLENFYSANILGCSETSRGSSQTSIAPISNSLSSHSSKNIDDVSSSTSSNVVSSSSMSSFSSSQVSSNLANPDISNSAPVSEPSRLPQGSSSGFSMGSIEQVNPNVRNPHSSNIIGCPDIDPTCSHTSVMPIPNAPNNQYLPPLYSQNVAPVLSISASQSSILGAETTSSTSSNFGQTSSSTSTPNDNSFILGEIGQSKTSNIIGCPEIDPTCSFTSVLPASLAASQSSISVTESSSSISSEFGSSSSSSFSANQVSLNSGLPCPSNELSKCETDHLSCDSLVVSSTPDFQSSVSVTASSVSSDLAQTSSYSSSIDVKPTIVGKESPSSSFSSNIVPLSMSSISQSSLSSIEATNSDSSVSAQASAVSTTATSNPKVATESTSISSIAVANSTSAPSTKNIASSSASLASVADISTSSLPASKTITATSTSVTASEVTINTHSSTQQNIPLPDSPVVKTETTATSSTTSSSPTNGISATSLVSSTATDTTNILEQSALPVQSTTSSESSSSSILTSHTPTSFPSSSPTTFAVALSSPLQNMFNLEINPLTLEVEIPSCIRSSIVSINPARSYGCHEFKIPACIPTQLSCALRSY